MSPEDKARLDKVSRVLEGHGTLTEARETAGLSIAQAARLSGIEALRLNELESDNAGLTTQEHRLLTILYDVPGFNGALQGPEGEARNVIQCRDCMALSLAGETPRHTAQCVLIACARTRGGGHG